MLYLGVFISQSHWVGDSFLSRCLVVVFTTRSCSQCSTYFCHSAMASGWHWRWPAWSAPLGCQLRIIYAGRSHMPPNKPPAAFSLKLLIVSSCRTWAGGELNRVKRSHAPYIGRKAVLQTANLNQKNTIWALDTLRPFQAPATSPGAAVPGAVLLPAQTQHVSQWMRRTANC